MISVLIVEDDPVAAEAHELYVQRIAGFETAGRVRTGQAALRFLEQTPVDLVLLDLRLPDMDGLRVSRALRKVGSGTDVIAVTSARDLRIVRESVASGVVQYLLKPFTFAAMRDKLEHYAQFRSNLGHDREASGQGEIDRAFSALRAVSPSSLPKGMSEETLTAVVSAMRERPHGASAETIGRASGVSRVTARRYLEYLVDTGMAVRRPQYGGVGRPEMVYLRNTET
ncbi:response regulator of citrate/malate metabolism [Halopolyspora algeriensis]|uniref:Transcriptional regulatory protein n=1 Tax=Halopolyspora algeriensis TaxID=1500506 RepID=A0A368VNX9_9ACTN|nr:response regulator [Halopolyspora algeriensis]RCW43228.1 response regulator of citrate/malate metabolism [Halopolyspora algeriensis]TQM56287.1 response regulator of citrate/malate metabolism [Halopolyspora algeriensis]